MSTYFYVVQLCLRASKCCPTRNRSKNRRSVPVTPALGSSYEPTPHTHGRHPDGLSRPIPMVSSFILREDEETISLLRGGPL